MGALKAYAPRDNKYVEAKNKLLNNVKNFYEGREKIIEGFKNEIFLCIMMKSKKNKLNLKEKQEKKEEERKRKNKKKSKKKKQEEQKKESKENTFFKYIENKSKGISNDLFRKYFNFKTRRHEGTYVKSGKCSIAELPEFRWLYVHSQSMKWD